MSLILNVEILGEFKKLTAATVGAQNSLSGLQKKATSIARGIGRVVGALGLTLGFSAMVRGFQDATRAAEEAQVANDRIDAIALSMAEFGTQTQKVTNRIKAYAEQQSLSVGVDDEVIKATQAKLLTFRNLTKTAGTMGGAFDRATNAAIDMAAAGFGSATSNATQLGKALNDPIKGITALNRAGIQFTEDQKALIQSLVDSGKMLEAQDIILSEIEAQVGGTAAATATASQKMTIAFGEVSESVGAILLPVVERFSEWLIDVLPDIQKFFAELMDPTTDMGKKWNGMIGILDNTGKAFDNLMGVFSGGQSKQGALMDWVTTLAAGMGQIVFYLTRQAELFQALMRMDFGRIGELAGNFGSDYDRFVRQQNQSLLPPTTQQQRDQALRNDRQGTTIIINRGNITAKEIADKVNKQTKVTGGPRLNSGTIRAQ